MYQNDFRLSRSPLDAFDEPLVLLVRPSVVGIKPERAIETGEARDRFRGDGGVGRAGDRGKNLRKLLAFSLRILQATVALLPFYFKFVSDIRTALKITLNKFTFEARNALASDVLQTSGIKRS